MYPPYFNYGESIATIYFNWKQSVAKLLALQQKFTFCMGKVLATSTVCVCKNTVKIHWILDLANGLFLNFKSIKKMNDPLRNVHFWNIINGLLASNYHITQTAQKESRLQGTYGDIKVTRGSEVSPPFLLCSVVIIIAKGLISINHAKKKLSKFCLQKNELELLCI